MPKRWLGLSSQTDSRSFWRILSKSMETLSMGKKQMHTMSLGCQNQSHDLFGLWGQCQVPCQWILVALNSPSLEPLTMLFTGHWSCHESMFSKILSLHILPNYKETWGCQYILLSINGYLFRIPWLQSKLLEKSVKEFLSSASIT